MECVSVRVGAVTCYECNSVVVGMENCPEHDFASVAGNVSTKDGCKVCEVSTSARKITITHVRSLHQHYINQYISTIRITVVDGGQHVHINDT